MIRARGATIAASALALAVAGCAAPVELTRYPKARVAAPAARIEQIRAELARARAFAGLFTRFLPLEQRHRLEALAAGVDAALAIAEATGTSAAVDQADDRLEDYRFAAGA